jgi:hypothetical protein
MKACRRAEVKLHAFLILTVAWRRVVSFELHCFTMKDSPYCPLDKIL